MMLGQYTESFLDPYLFPSYGTKDTAKKNWGRNRMRSCQ